MANFNKYSKLLYSQDPVTAKDRSVKWFKENVNRLDLDSISRANVTISEIKNDNVLEPLLLMGYMTLFQYRPITREKLPYYDNFPLIVPIYRDNIMFKGLNLHYLPYDLRAALMDKLIIRVNNRDYNEQTKFMLDYSFLKGFRKLKEAKPCLKQYYFNRVRSGFIKILPEDWNNVVFLPIERFKKQTKKRVWYESRKTIENVI